jgi:hypothetical protein
MLNLYVEFYFLYSGTSPLKFNVLKDTYDISSKINEMKEKDRKNPIANYVICIFRDLFANLN